MAKQLIDKFTWEEITEQIILKCNYDKPKFKNWLLTKEGLGGYYFSALLWLRAYHIQDKINNEDLDHFIVVTGKEGSGKSTLAIQLACVIDPNFKLNRICFTMMDFLKQIEDAPKGACFILDEGNLFLSSREAMTLGNRFMQKLMAVMRQRNLCVIINVPNFWTVDSYVRNHRTDTLIYVNSRGNFRAYKDIAIPLCSKWGMATKSFNGVKVPSNHVWKGSFNRYLPTINDISHEQYKNYKADTFTEFLEDLKTFVEETDRKNNKFVSIREAKGIIPLQDETIIKNIKSGEFKGKKVGGKWFILRKSLEK